jgi:hypothetical protein
MSSRTINTELTFRFKTKVYEGGSNKWGLPELEDGTPLLLQPSKASLEFYDLPDHKGGIGSYGVRIVLPEGRVPDMYSPDESKGERTPKIMPLEGGLQKVLRSVCLDPYCVEVVDFDGKVTDTSDMDANTALAGIAARMAESALREKYNEYVEDGIVPKNMSFERFVELELGTDKGSVH